jgi:hypothetical protein
VLSEKIRTSLISQLRLMGADEEQDCQARPFPIKAAATNPQAGVQVWHLQEVCDLAESALAKMQLRRMGCVLERSNSRDVALSTACEEDSIVRRDATATESACPRCAADPTAPQPQLELSKQAKLLTGRVPNAAAEVSHDMQARRTYVTVWRSRSHAAHEGVSGAAVCMGTGRREAGYELRNGGITDGWRYG